MDRKGSASEQRDAQEARQIELETIEKSNGILTENERERFQCISIIGQIEGHYL